jgi:hypothetical protein
VVDFAGLPLGSGRKNAAAHPLEARQSLRLQGTVAAPRGETLCFAYPFRHEDRA